MLPDIFKKAAQNGVKSAPTPFKFFKKETKTTKIAFRYDFNVKIIHIFCKIPVS